MKRMNVLIDEFILDEVRKQTGAESYSAAINAALKECLRLSHVRHFAQFAGSGIWEGDLAEMREDKPSKKKVVRKPTRSKQ